MYRACPVCSFTVAEVGNPLYVVCTNSTCPIHYIPKKGSTRRALMTYIESESTLLYQCLKCALEIYPSCMPHNTKYFVCYNCDFKNPYTHKYDTEIRRFLHGGSGRYGDWPRCTMCNLYFDNYKSNSTLCNVCIYTSPKMYDFDLLYVDYWTPCTEINPESYEETSEHILNLDYLPTCS